MWMSSRSSGVMKERSSRVTTSWVMMSASCSRRLIDSTIGSRRSISVDSSTFSCLAASTLRVATLVKRSKNRSSLGRRRIATSR